MVSKAIPTQIDNSHNLNFVSAANAYCVGTNANGELFCWGYNGDGQFANGTTMNVYAPAAIDCPTSLAIASNKTNTEVVYPNPTTDFVNIELQDALIQTVFVYDIQGRLLWSKNVNAYTAKLSLSDQVSGLYIIKITTATASKSYKILKN
jgi:hypothetical protein